MELNEAIKHCHEKAEEIRKANEEMPTDCKLSENLCECANEHEQLAAWLEELAERREIDRWISVDEALPEKEGWYLVDRKERTSSIQYFFFSTVNHKPYWSGECKVYYWRPLPERYRESEATNGTDN